MRHTDQMTMSSPYLIVLTEAEDRALAAKVGSGRTGYRDRLRAQIVLEAAHGGSNAGIAAQLQIGVDAVRRWRRRFATATGERLEALTDRPRSGRPPVHGPAVRAETVALACALPAENDVPLSRWSCPETARELAARCHVAVSASSVRRWLADDALNRGSTAPGSPSATRTSRSRPPGCWTCTPGSGTGNRWDPTTS